MPIKISYNTDTNRECRIANYEFLGAVKDKSGNTVYIYNTLKGEPFRTKITLREGDHSIFRWHKGRREWLMVR